MTHLTKNPTHDPCPKSVNNLDLGVKNINLLQKKIAQTNQSHQNPAHRRFIFLFQTKKMAVIKKSLKMSPKPSPTSSSFGPQLLKRIKIKTLLDINMSERQIKAQLGCGFDTIRAVKKQSMDDILLGRKQRCDVGKSKTLSPSDKQKIKRRIHKKQGSGCRTVAKVLNKSRDTIRRYLKTTQWGAKYKRAIVKTPLSQKNKNDRMRVCHYVQDELPRLLNCSPENVIKYLAFSDECPARRSTMINKWNMGMRTAGEAPTILRIRGGVSVTLAAAVSMWGATPLKIYDGDARLTAEDYCDTLKFYDSHKKALFPTTSHRQKCRWIEDGSPLHRAKITCRFRQETGMKPLVPKPYRAKIDGQDCDVMGFVWGGNGPDMNFPIESWWSHLKRQVALKKPKGKAGLIRCLKTEHQKMIREGYPKKFCQTWLDTVEKCRSLNGGWTGH